VIQHLTSQGASFFDEIAEATHLLRTELEDALSELVVHGRVHCDSFAGVRSLLVPASKRSLPASRRRRGGSLSGIQDAGRWALVKRAYEPSADPAGAAAGRPAALEQAARTLLRRYGVICWRLLEREAAWLPPWRELVRVYQRLEARGEIRGGRFIAGLSASNSHCLRRSPCCVRCDAGPPGPNGSAWRRRTRATCWEACCPVSRCHGW
jgi:ATP-dependent Lhr-like helicase